MKIWPRPQRGQYAVRSGRMDRVVVIGCGGSGKTYVARRLAEHLNLPLTHLDGVYYDADWNPLPQDDFADRQRELVARPRWLIEGNYASTLPVRLVSADTVIFLDLPAITCLVGILQRRWHYRGGQHARDGVYDRITWNFVRYIWGYRKTMRPEVRKLITEHARTAQLITLTSRTDTTQFLAGAQTWTQP